MKRLAIEHLEPYFQHRLAVQYTGILNVTELSKWDKENRDIDVFDDPETPKPEEVCGLKIGWVKHVRCYKKGIELVVGVRKPAKVFAEHNLSGFKPVLRPLSDLTKEINHRGEKVTLMSGEDSFLDYGDICFDSIDGVEIVNDVTPYFIMQTLHKYIFDTAGLIPAGLAIDVNTLTENPYEK